MKRASFITKVKNIIASIGWKLFIWGNETTEEDYWHEIYEQEAALSPTNENLPRKR